MDITKTEMFLLIFCSLSIIENIVWIFIHEKAIRRFNDRIMAKSLSEMKFYEKSEKNSEELLFPQDDELLAKKEKIRLIKMRAKLDKELDKAKRQMEKESGVKQL